MPIPLISTISTSFQFRPSRGRRSTKALAHASHIHVIELDPELCSLLAAPEHTNTPKRPVTLNGKGSMYWICQQLPGGAPITSQQAPTTYLRLLLQKLVDRESTISLRLSLLLPNSNQPRSLRQSGNATQKSPVAGFSSPGLAALFNMPFPQSPSPSTSRRTISRGAILGATIGGSVALLGFSVLALYLFRDRLRQFAYGAPEPRLEMDNTQRRVVNEIMDKETYWELDAGEKGTAKRPSSAPRELSADSITTVKVVEPRVSELIPLHDDMARSTEPNARASTPGVASMGGTMVVSSPVGTPGELDVKSEERPKWPKGYDGSMEGVWI